MSTMDLSLLLTRAERRAMTGASVAPLRVMLLAGEVISLPRASASLRVLAGIAWVTRSGSDKVLPAGHAVSLGGAGDCAVVSAVGGEPVLVEVS